MCFIMDFFAINLFFSSSSTNNLRNPISTGFKLKLDLRKYIIIYLFILLFIYLYIYFIFQYTLSGLLSKVQASETELLEALKKIGAIEIDGGLKLINIIVNNRVVVYWNTVDDCICNQVSRGGGGGGPGVASPGNLKSSKM